MMFTVDCIRNIMHFIVFIAISIIGCVRNTGTGK